MGKIYNLFSEQEPPPSTHSLESANRLLPIVLKHTTLAARRTSTIALKMERHPKKSAEFQALAKEYDSVVAKWVEVIHRIGAVAKGLWLVDFDTGEGYLCWSFPERRVEHFHPYGTGFKNRTKIKKIPKSVTSIEVSPEKK